MTTTPPTYELRCPACGEDRICELAQVTRALVGAEPYAAGYAACLRDVHGDVEEILGYRCDDCGRSSDVLDPFVVGDTRKEER